MRQPTLVDIIADLQDTSEDLDAEDVDFGDPDNDNITIPEITDFSSVVSYYASGINKTPYGRVTWSWTRPVIYDEDNNPIDQTDPDILDDMNFDPVVDYMFRTNFSTFASTKGSTSVVTEAHPLGINVVGYVYAVLASGVIGPVVNYTAAVSKDTVAPNKPSTPTVTSSNGIISVTLDGKDSSGNPMPNDFLQYVINAGYDKPPSTQVVVAAGPGSYQFYSEPTPELYPNPNAASNLPNALISSRWSWTKQLVTGITGAPSGITTGVKVTCPTAGARVGAGIDLAQNIDVAVDTTKNIPVVAGETYFVSVVGKIDSPSNPTIPAGLNIRVNNGTAWLTTYNINKTVNSGQYFIIEGVFTAPVGATYVGFQLVNYASVTWAVGDTFFASGISVKKAVNVQVFAQDVSYNTSVGSDTVAVVSKSVLDGSGLAAALNGRNRIYAQSTDPSLTTTIIDGDWWFKVIANQISNYYQYVNGAWTEDKLNASTVIAALSVVTANLAADAVTADKIMAGEIYAKLATTGELNADVIRSGLLTAAITLSGVIRTAESGARVVMDINGITLYDSSNNPVIVISTTGDSFFSGNIIATTLDIKDNTIMRGQNNILASNATLTLTSKISDPKTPPSVANVYTTIGLLDSVGAQLSNMWTDRLSDGKFISRVSGGYVVNNTDGTYNRSIAASVGTESSCVVIGNYVYAMAKGSPCTVYRTNITTGNTVSAALDFNETVDGVAFVVGTNGTQLVIKRFNSTNGFRFYNITTTTGDNFTLALATSTSTGTNYFGPFYIGNADFGSSYLVNLTKAGTNNYFAVSTAPGAAVDATKNFAPGMINPKGLGYYSSVFWSAHNGFVLLYEGPVWADSQTYGYKNLDVGFTFRGASSNSYESTLSPKTVFTHYRRAKISITVPGWLSDTSSSSSVEQLKFYAGNNGGTLYYQNIASINSVTLATLATSGGTPPGSNNFPVIPPAKIQSANADLVISADGTLLIPPAKFRGYPIKWNGSLGGSNTSTLTASNYRSIKPNTTEYSTGEWTPTWNGDCLVIPYKSWIRVVFEVVFEANSGGNRFIAMNLDPGITTNNNSTYPSTGRMIYTKSSPSSDSTGLICYWEGPVNANANIMFLVRSTVAVKVLGQPFETRVFVTIERMLD